MNWLERLGWVIVGALATFAVFWFNGRLSLSSEFAANVTGAAVGGAISVSLALWMFQKERKIAISEAASARQTQRLEAIRQALRHVRAIQECISGAIAITINSSERILRSLKTAEELTIRALEDHNLTDIPLRLTMEDAARIAADTAARLNHDLQSANLQDANLAAPSANEICANALQAIDKLTETYTKIRMLPIRFEQ